MRPRTTCCARSASGAPPPGCRASRSAGSTGCTSRSSRGWRGRAARSRSARSAATAASACCAGWATPGGSTPSSWTRGTPRWRAHRSRSRGSPTASASAAERLRDVERDAPFDLVFVDADKTGYPAYLAWAEEHLRVGGILLADNTFGFGHVHEARPAGESAEAMAALRRFSERLAGGGRFRATMLPTAEGLSLGVKIR